MEKIRKFELAIENSNLETDKNNIGRLREKALHSILKYYYCSDSSYHEVKVGRYVADIKFKDDITEIQTGNFYSMKKKLDYYLSQPQIAVNIVFPVANTKWVSWIDTQTGEVSSKRKSPKKGSIYQILPELYSLKDYIFRDGITFSVCLIDLDEYKYLDGWSHDKKRGCTKFERVPIALIDDVQFESIDDYYKFIPHSLGSEFTLKEFQKATKLSPKKAGLALAVLRHIKVVTQVGKKGRSFLYQRS